MALEETNELVLKHSATGSEQAAHSFQSFYVKHTDDKGETHYVPVQFMTRDDILALPIEEQAGALQAMVGYIVTRTRQES